MRLEWKSAQTFKGQKSLGIREELAYVVKGSTAPPTKGIRERIVGREGIGFIFVSPKLSSSTYWFYYHYYHSCSYHYSLTEKTT